MNCRKSIFKFLGIAAVCAASAACSVDDADDLALVKLGALKKEFVVEADANTFDIDIYANSAFHIERINQADWISLTCGETEDGKGAITAECEFNEGFKRKAGFVLCSDVDARRDTVYVKQKALVDAKIEFANSSVIVAGAGGENISPIETNIPFSEITVDIEYAKADNADWIESLEIVDSESEKRSLSITTEANAADEIPRSAAVSLSFTDGWEETVSVEFNLLQRTAKETLGRQITFEEFRQTYAMNKKVEDYVILEGIVVSNTKSHNAGENTQSTTAKIDYSISDRTVYLETYDGKYGIAVQTATAEDNVFEQYDHVQILIQGASGYLVETPDRYELRNVTKAMVISRIAGSASDVPVKEKWMSQLTDDDIYTYCALSGLEFSVKEGAYTNVREYDAIGNPCNANLSFAGGTQAQKAKDGAANLLYDGDNDAIYMLVNMNCGWRRTGRSVPQGVGTVSGIVVHTPMERWGGNVGRYSIRPFDEADIDIPRAAASAYATLVEWRLDKAVISVGAYKWNDNGTYTVGSAANSATQLVQNRMHATTDNTGGGARLYSENRMLNQTVTADRSYPIAIVHGYRGLNVSNYVPGDGTTMGMSKYTMLGFLGNVAGWYEWNGDTWTGKTNGIVMEFSTAGVGGSAAAVSFSTAAGKHSTNEAACSWTNASSYPVYWKVEYATSADGATWSDYTEAVNAATGERGFEMRSLPWCINNSSTRTSVFDTANRSGVYTQSDFGFGLVPYRFVLPAEVLGKAKVRVRISPSSDVIATWNPGIDGYALGQTHRNLRIARTYPFDIANGVYVEDLSIQYK